MSTRSMIGICDTQGKVRAIYCHYDGYPSYNGRILIEHYNTQDRVEKLIALGNISSLAEKLEPDPKKPHNSRNHQKDVVFAYARDDGSDLEVSEFDSVRKFLMETSENVWIEWCYLFDTNIGQWYVAHMNFTANSKIKLKRLSDVLAEIRKGELKEKQQDAGGEE